MIMMMMIILILTRMHLMLMFIKMIIRMMLMRMILMLMFIKMRTLVLASEDGVHLFQEQNSRLTNFICRLTSLEK